MSIFGVKRASDESFCTRTFIIKTDPRKTNSRVILRVSSSVDRDLLEQLSGSLSCAIFGDR